MTVQDKLKQLEKTYRETLKEIKKSDKKTDRLYSKLDYLENQLDIVGQKVYEAEQKNKAK